MKIVSVQFSYEAEANIYGPLLDVFRKSCARHMPDVEFESMLVPPPILRAGVKRGFSTNTEKLNLWARAVNDTDRPLLLSDCDMLCLRDLRDLWDRDFDLAYTVRSDCRLPFNSGVVFVRPTSAARRFVTDWRGINERMLKDWTFHQLYRQKYWGMNQASFGWMLENRTQSECKLLKLPCLEWNACNEDWDRLDLKSARLVHFKGKLRSAALQPEMVVGPLQPLVREWKRYRGN